MTPDVGTIDRLPRAALGLGLLYLAIVSALPAFDGAILKSLAALVGAVMLAIATTRTGPVCAALGIKTSGA